MAEDTAQEAKQENTGPDPVDSTEQDDAQDVDALLGEIKKLRSENAKWRTSLRKLEAEREEKQRAEMTELERLKADLEAEREARTLAEQERRRTLVRSQVVASASRLDFADPQDAYRMLDLDGLDVGEDGTIAGLDTALKKLAESKPYLLKRNATQFSPTNPSGGAPGPTSEQILAQIYGPKRSKLFEGGGVVWNTQAE